MVERFRLEDVQRSPAFFDVKKLAHMNGEYIRALPVDGFIDGGGPGSTRCRERGRRARWRDPDTGAPATAPPPWDAGALRRRRLRRRWPR